MVSGYCILELRRAHGIAYFGVLKNVKRIRSSIMNFDPSELAIHRSLCLWFY